MTGLVRCAVTGTAQRSPFMPCLFQPQGVVVVLRMGRRDSGELDSDCGGGGMHSSYGGVS